MRRRHQQEEYDTALPFCNTEHQIEGLRVIMSGDLPLGLRTGATTGSVKITGWIKSIFKSRCTEAMIAMIIIALVVSQTQQDFVRIPFKADKIAGLQSIHKIFLADNDSVIWSVHHHPDSVCWKKGNENYRML